MLLYRHPRIEVIVAGGAVRRADGAVIGSTAISLIGQFKVDYAIIGASAIDEEGASGLRLSRSAGGAGNHRQRAQRSCWSPTPPNCAEAPPVRIAHISQIQTS